MSYLSYFSRLGAFAFLLVNLACGPEIKDKQTTSELLSGSETFQRPEIGRLHLANNSLCTATLIAPQIVITAAHCVDYRTSEEGHSEHYGYFVIDRENRSPAWYAIDKVKSFGFQPGADDFALLRLEAPVDSAHATPTEISYGDTGYGSQVTIFGYGCTDRTARNGSGVKRRFETRYDESFNLCPGDSGGPVVLGHDGPVLLINSAYYVRSGKDIFARPYQLRSEIETQIEAWTIRAAPILPEPEPPTPTCMGGEKLEDSLAVSFPVEGKICASRDTWLSVELESGDSLTLQVRFEHERGDIDISLHDRRGRQISNSQGTSDLEELQFQTHQAGKYHLRIYGFAGAENNVRVEGNIEPR